MRLNDQLVVINALSVMIISKQDVDDMAFYFGHYNVIKFLRQYRDYERNWNLESIKKNENMNLIEFPVEF